jgi:hypothetical protein
LQLIVPDASDENGGIDGISKNEALRVPDYSRHTNILSFGKNIMVQTASLHILALATARRMTPERVWRLAMHQGLSRPYEGFGLDGIDYGEIDRARGQDQSLVPDLSLHEIIKLESLGDVELVKKAIIDDGKFWVWMRPDR